MPRIKQKDNGKGSLKLLQRLINEREDLINDQLRASIGINPAIYIEWLSPKNQDHYAEYKDRAFIEKTRYSNENSKQLILNSLQETKDFLKCRSTLDWTKHYYQYANRTAHLYYLRVLNEIPSYLVFIYFIGDVSVNGPSTKEEWQDAINVMRNKMGTTEQHPLSKYIVDLFIHVSEI